MSKTIFTIETGQIGLALVDKAAVGYLDSWQAPGGKTADVVTLADYDSNSTGWSCQIVNGALNATPDTTTTDVPATWCEPAETIPSPGKTTYEFGGSFLQDPNVRHGLNRWLFQYDTQEAYIYASWGGDNPPSMIGRVRVAAGTIGGEARTNLTADFTMPLTRKPDIDFGTTADHEVVTGAGTKSTGATAGIPGFFTPAGSATPATLAAMSAAPAVTASPTTAWTVGQHVVVGDGTHVHWSSTAWVTGNA